MKSKEMIDQLIELNAKKLALLKELKESIKYESCQYHLVKNSKRENNYFLIRIENKKIVIEANSRKKIIEWAERRGISKALIYNS